MAEDTLTPFFKNLFGPTYIDTFHGGFKEVKVLHFTSSDGKPTEIKLKPYPFMTLNDLKTMIYQHFAKKISAHPSFQSLLIPVPELADTNEEETKFVRVYDKLADSYTCFEYTWTKPESVQELTLINPFERASGSSVDTQFVTESGRKTNTYAIRSRMTLEDFAKELDLGDSITVHLFLYEDVIPGMRAELRTSEREWFGRMNPYYPDLSINQSPTTLPTELVQRATVYDAYVESYVSQIDKLNELLSSETLPLLPISVVGLRFLRLVWKTPETVTPSLENLFYTMEVTGTRPFLRILPIGTTPITKLKMDSTFKIPEISDPRLLRIWKDERSPKPDTDFLFSKMVIRRTAGSQPALYGTLRMFHDKSADFLILPPKQVRFLDPRSDLSALGSLLTDGLSVTPYKDVEPEVGEASLLCAIRLPLTKKPMTSDALRKRLQHFKPLFQEIAPLPGDKPLLMLRYRAVSNYAMEDKIYSFLTLMVSRTITKGEAAIPELVVSLQKEFQMSQEDAQSKVLFWLRNRGEIQLAIPESKDYIMTYNPGIDIAIFGQQSYYTIHLYRVDSKKVFDRIVTAISVLLSATDKQLGEAIDAPLFERAAASATVTMPGAGIAAAGSAAEALLSPPENAASAATNNNNALSSANLGDDMYLRMMMGGPAAQDNNADGTGEGELFNLGNALSNERAATAANVNVHGRVVENTRAAEAAVARAAEAAVTGPPKEEAEAEEEEEETAHGKKKKSYQGWVKSQLQIADQRLFQYETDIAGRKIKKYVTMCQATESRQPYVLNQEQYEVMRETYEKDDGVVFLVYPLEAGEALPEAGDEVYTLLKYGTNPLKQNYYLCCQFFCTRDYLMVREKDFYSTVDRQGNPKPGESSPGKKDNGSCPFCKGTEIKVLKSPGSNETVLQRRTKKSETKRHLYVGFLQGETQHPEEFYMPCCFTEDSPLYISDPRFEKVRMEKEEEKEKEDEEREVRTTAGVPTTSYQITMYRAHKKYIVGPEKVYLKISEIDGPQIGLVPTVLDKYFGQTPKEYVSRTANKMELLPTAKCFLRVGVENRPAQLHDSFFAALAPYLEFRNTAEAVKARIREVITPRIFTFLNYGNLVLEFYDPGDPGPTEQELRTWISRELQIELSSTNKDAAMRIWKSYHHFLGFLESNQVKEYRQFAQMLALRGLLTPRGLVLIVLELNDKDELQVRCPPFGYNIEQYNSSDIAFILHRSSGIWEPLFYSENRPQTARFRAVHQPEITFQSSMESWPPIVKQRVSEFKRQCQGIGRGAYTSSRRIDPMALIPLSVGIQSMPRDATGVVRDAYNHVVAITYRAKAGKPGLVALPVIDDEFIAVSRTIHLDWDDYTPAPMDAVVKFYNETFERIFSLYPGYKVKRRIKSRATDRYVAVQLANGLYIPVAPPKDESEVSSLPLGKVDEMEWSMNREIYFASEKGESEETVFKAREHDVHEIFEHLRLTFSNWFSSESASPEFRDQVKAIIDSKALPLFEKRKRLEILLGPMILGWMDSETPKGEVEGSLLRVDCRLETKAPCPSRCVWRQKADESVGRCYLHSPKQLHLGGRLVNGPRLLMLRLLEELLRFPDRRNQLLKGDVSSLVGLKDAVKIGTQYVLPENSIAWHDLLRLDWIQQGREVKKYYEEMSRAPSETEEEERKTESKEEEPVEGLALPATLKELFGADDPKTAKLYLLKSEALGLPLNPYLVPLGTDAAALGMAEDSPVLDRDAVKRLTLHLRRPVLYINMNEEPIDVLSFSTLKRQKSPTPFILVSTAEGPRLLSSSKKFPQDIQPLQMPRLLKELVEDSISIQD